MEITNRSLTSSSDAYIQKQQANNASQNNVSQIEHIKDGQTDKHKSSESTALSSTKNTEQISEPRSLDLLEPINLMRARKLDNTHESRMEYKVEAHEEQLAYQAEKAINYYYMIENSQYGQELVNRIELMV